APSGLSRADTGILHAAVIPRRAGVVHVGLALFQKSAMAGERVEAFLAGDLGVGLLLDALIAVRPLDLKAFLLEQAFVIRHQFRQALEGRCRLQDKLLHCHSPTLRFPWRSAYGPANARDAGDQPLF